MHIPARSGRVLAAFGLTLCLALSLGLAISPASAADRADLVVTKHKLLRTSVLPGRRLPIRVTTRNRGDAEARVSLTRIYLSKNRKLSKRDPVVGKYRVSARQPGTRMASKIRVKIPRRVWPGRYYLLACADAKQQVRESREGNNCRVSHGRIRVHPALRLARPQTPEERAEMLRKQSVAMAAELEKYADPAFFFQASDLEGRTVAFTHDDAAAVTQTIGAAGGTLEVTTATGDLLRLTIPADALLGDVEITATPVTTVEGTEDAGATPLGLRLQPTGLTLLEPATLEVAPADGGTPAIGLSGNGDGSGVVPALLLPDVDRTALSVMSFSHHVVLVPAGEAGFTAPYFTDAEYAASRNTRVVRLLTDERNAQLAGSAPDPAVTDQARALLDEEYQQVIEPLANASRTDCTYAEANFHTAIAHVRQAAQVGLLAEGSAKELAVEDAMLAATQNCWDQALTQCMRMDPAQYRRLVGLAEQLSTMGVEDPQADDVLALTDADWCHNLNGWIDYAWYHSSWTSSNDDYGSSRDGTARIWLSTDASVRFAEQIVGLRTLADTDDSLIDLNAQAGGGNYSGSSTTTWYGLGLPFEGPDPSASPVLEIDFLDPAGRPGLVDPDATLSFLQTIHGGERECSPECSWEVDDPQMTLLYPLWNDDEAPKEPGRTPKVTLDPETSTLTLSAQGEKSVMAPSGYRKTVDLTGTLFAQPPAS